jgi:hypothetical protein
MTQAHSRSALRRIGAALALLVVAAVAIPSTGCAVAPDRANSATTAVGTTTSILLTGDATPALAPASVFDVQAGRVRWTDVMPWVVIGIMVIVLVLVISAI